MPIVRVKDRDGNWAEIPALVGPKGADGTMTFEELTDEQKASLKGDKGDKGDPGYTPIKGVDYFDGKDGKDGANGTNGKDGYTPIKGVDYFDGQNGKDGSNGKDGTDGRTPVKGTDYYTEADKAEMVQAVISALPVYDGSVTSV